MFFLGRAANFSSQDKRHHTFAIGFKKDSNNLKNYLAKRYQASAENIALTANGRSALTIALKTFLSKDSKVLINGFTCHAVLEAVRAAKCIPIYADINLTTLHYDDKTLKAALTKYPDISAIIVQNTFSIPVNIKPIQKIAKENNLFIIEDLAHCVGAHYDNKTEVGTIGDATALSFGKGKAVDTISGGAVIIRKDTARLVDAPKKRQKLSDTLRARWYPLFGAISRGLARIHLDKINMAMLLKIHFIERSADAKLNVEKRMPHWQAKLALEKMRKLTKTNKPLREFFLVKNRDEVLAKLKKAGFNFDEFWYEVPISPARYYKKVHFPEKECPNATLVAAKIVNIPNYYKKSDLKPAIKIIKENLDE
ncbi:DegT/DnrJ/EryC1/StrS family aminotransferase [Candidatus Saccharibacteria bacterium]|nr:DegT/DnrJ/EryC1/StrS family aminotransferase [Candidatus Saccharibacteria bacterium]